MFLAYKFPKLFQECKGNMLQVFCLHKYAATVCDSYTVTNTVKKLWSSVKQPAFTLNTELNDLRIFLENLKFMFKNF